MTGPATHPAADPGSGPTIVVRDEASAEEVAAVVAVLQVLAAAAAADAADDEPARVRSEWSAPRRALRRPHAPGPGAWRASALAP